MTGFPKQSGFLVLGSGLVAFMGCMPTPTDVLPGDPGGSVQLAAPGGAADSAAGEDRPARAAIVKTQIAIGDSGRIEAGDDVIVFGTGYGDDFYLPGDGVDAPRYVPPEGVHYLRPSQTDRWTTSAATIRGSDVLFGHDNFKVAGTKVALVRSTKAVSIFDTRTATLVDIAATEITLDNETVDLGPDSQMHADGNLIVTVNDSWSVSDGHVVKVIDVSGARPNVISLPNPGGADSDNFNQAVVHAASRTVVGVDFWGGNLHVWDIDDPTALPKSYDFGAGDAPASIGPETAIQFDGTHVLFHDNSKSQFRAAAFNVQTAELIHFTDGPVRQWSELALAQGRFVYFLARENADEGDASGAQRSVIGSMDAPYNVTLADQLTRYPLRPGFVGNQGRCATTRTLVGYGATVAVTPDGSRTFLAGYGFPHGYHEYIQMSTGGEFTDFADPDGTSQTGALLGTDIDCSDDVAAFRGVRHVQGTGCSLQADQVLSFIRLEMLD